MRGLLDHRRMQSIARRPALLVRAVTVDEPGEERFRGLVPGVVGRMGKFVDGEGEGEEGEGDIESFLSWVQWC